MRDWSDLVPQGVAIRQHDWERGQGLLRMKRAGFSVSEMVVWLEIPRRAVDRMLSYAEYSPHARVSPVEEYLAGTRDAVVLLAAQLKAIGGFPPPCWAEIKAVVRG